MFNNQTIRSLFSGYKHKYGSEDEAILHFLDKYPDAEGELNLLLTGELQDPDPNLRVHTKAKPEDFEIDEDQIEDSDEEFETTIHQIVEQEATAADEDDQPEIVSAVKEPAIKEVLTDEPKPEQPVQKQTQEVQPPATQSRTRSGSKMERALAIYLESPDKRRKTIMARLINELGMTPAGASTYYALVKQRAGSNEAA